MADNFPFVRSIDAGSGTEPGAIVGFSLPFLPDMLTSHWLSSPDAHKRLEEALQLQIHLINAFWNLRITAWDLRFVGTDELPGVAIGLLCRIRRPSNLEPRQFHASCLDLAKQAQQLFADYGYELFPLSDEKSLSRYLTPFHFQTVGEVRKAEELLTFEDAYTEYDVYITYPWYWRIQNRLRLFEAFLHRQSNCLVSINLEPTQLSQQEQRHLNHATSAQLRDMLYNSGPHGQAVYKIYADYTRCLRRPYLLRVGLAAATAETVTHFGRIFIDELYTPQHPGSSPILYYPQNRKEWQWACSSLSNAACIPWGENRGMDLPGTARLRYLVDERMASMAFRLPVARYTDIPGLPVRSLTPTTSKAPTPGAAGRNFYSAPTSTQSTPAPFQAPTAGTTSAALDIQKPGDLVGKNLGSCHIEALLGQGGFGAVYRARQGHLDRLVAVKVVLAAISHADTQKRRNMQLRFEREAQAVARLDHPHILALYEYQVQPLPYFVMPYVAGGSLADELKSSGHRPLPAGGVAVILNQAASALDSAHQLQLVHRDIKPHNLLRHQDGRILLSDFGIVQFENDEHTKLTINKQDSPYTPSYASPEQHLGLNVDYRTDIYSLGIVIYELLCGHRPFKELYQHIQSPPPPMNSFGVQVSPAVEAVVVKALAKQPEQRYQSAGEMAAEFQRAVMHR